MQEDIPLLPTKYYQKTFRKGSVLFSWQTRLKTILHPILYPVHSFSVAVVSLNHAPSAIN